MSFHAGDGLYVERLDDGAVKVRLDPTEGFGHVVVVPADTWASVVAAVCARGENGGTWREARDFHNRT